MSGPHPTPAGQQHNLASPDYQSPGCPDSVFLLPFNSSSMQVALILARAMAEDGRMRPVLVPGRSTIDHADPGWQLPGVELAPLPQHEPEADRKTELSGRKASFWRRVRERINRIIWLQIWHEAQSLRRAASYARRLIDEFNPKAVVLFDDRQKGHSLPFLKAAREAGLPSIVVPFAYSSGRRDLPLRRSRLDTHQADKGGDLALKKWVRRRYPRQVYESPHGAVFFYPLAACAALAACGILPDDPWCLGGAPCDHLVVFGPEDRDRFVAEGIDPKKITITGDPSHDDLFRSARHAKELRDKLNDRYGLRPASKLVICALPQLYEHKAYSLDDHWREIRFLVGAMQESGAEVLLSLHPKAEPAKYQFLEEEFGVRLLVEPLRKALAAADIFVAVHSSTMLWAVVLGVPAVLLKYYWWQFDLFDHLPGLAKVSDRELLVPTLRSLVEDESYFQEMRRKQLQSASRIATLDGRATCRIIDLIMDCVERGAPGVSSL